MTRPSARGSREDIVLTRRGMDGFDGDHSDQYLGFPAAG